MLITVFPNRIETDPRHHPPCPLQHLNMADWPNVFVYYQIKKEHCEAHLSPLSIKTTFAGAEFYTFENRRVAVDDQTYLVLNRHRPYAYEISSANETESLAVFFQAGFAEEVLRSLITPVDQLLDDPYLESSQPVQFLEKLYQPDAIMSPLVRELRRLIVKQVASRGFYEESFHVLLERLLQVHRNVYKEVERLPAVRFSTRLELYRRLSQAKDFIDSNFRQQMTLDEISRVASLSKHHFLRLFKQSFQATPHQYLTQKRLELAKRLLHESDLSVTQVCMGVGFENMSSFSRLFRNHFSVSPNQARSNFI